MVVASPLSIRALGSSLSSHNCLLPSKPQATPLDQSAPTHSIMPSVPATYKAYVYTNAALNSFDYRLIEGLAVMITGGSPTTEKPYRIGFDAAGIVAEVGTNAASDFQVGDDVYASTPLTGIGSLAEYVTIDAQFVAPKPATLNFDEAAGVPGVALTSYQSLTEHAKLQAGERILVLGGTTSCGLFAIQYAKMIGAYVIATTSTKNVALLQSIGADQVIDYTSEKWGDVLAAHSVDVIFDCSVEFTAWDNDAQLVLKKTGGRFVTLRPVQTPSAPKFEATHMSVISQQSGKQLREIAHFIDSGKIKTFQDSTFAFENAAAAFKHLKTGRIVGKVILQIQ